MDNGAELDLLIAGGLVVRSGGRARLNIGIHREQIAYLGTERPPARRVIDADGLVVLPGAVDSHIHFMDPGLPRREDFPSGSRAAAAAGVTTVIEHTNAVPVRTASELMGKVDYLRGRSHVDYGLAAHAWIGHTEELEQVWRAGAAFFKVFTCDTDVVEGHSIGQLRRHLVTAADWDAPTLAHCEENSLLREARADLLAQSRDDGGLIPDWRTIDAELAAVAVVGLLARRTEARVVVAHVSHPEAARYIARERSAGARLGAESCPQYFLLREQEVLEHDVQRKFTPPARARTDRDEWLMWDLLRDGTITHIASDHAPCTPEEQREQGIWSSPFGVPGVDTTMSVLVDAVARGALAWEDIPRTYAERPAKLFGLWPRKGEIRMRADADLALIDPTIDWRIRDEDVSSRAGWSPYAGRSFRGRVVQTILRGQTIYALGEDHADPAGRWLPGAGSSGNHLCLPV